VVWQKSFLIPSMISSRFYIRGCVNVYLGGGFHLSDTILEIDVPVETSQLNRVIAIAKNMLSLKISPKSNLLTATVSLSQSCFIFKNILHYTLDCYKSVEQQAMTEHFSKTRKAFFTSPVFNCMPEKRHRHYYICLLQYGIPKRLHFIFSFALTSHIYHRPLHHFDYTLSCFWKSKINHFPFVDDHVTSHATNFSIELKAVKSNPSSHQQSSLSNHVKYPSGTLHHDMLTAAWKAHLPSTYIIKIILLHFSNAGKA
jgi:hypothetical protein